MNDSDEQRLVEAARRGSADAVGELFARHWDGAWGAAFAVLGDRSAADDAAQDAFQRAIARLERFDGRRPFRVWLHRIVVNAAIDMLRARRRLTALDEAADVADPGEPFESAQLVRALRRLPVDQRAAVVTHHVLGFSLAETAHILGVPLGTAQSRCGRGIAQLRNLLGVTP
ncbi:MAG: sigma-70 family RNA polymerase sigma factor [Thermoleophilia bacterium]